MGFRIEAAARTIEAGSPGRKSVLFWMAHRACDDCGFAWPGLSWLIESTEMAERSIRDALRALEHDGHIARRGYSTGGRARATEYVVLTSVVEFSTTAPCKSCVERRTNPAASAGYRGRRSNPATDAGFVGQENDKPGSRRVENPATGAPHQSENQYQSGSPPARADENSLSLASLPGTIPEDVRRQWIANGWLPPTQDPANAEDALRTVRGPAQAENHPQGPTKGTAQG